MLPTGKLLPGLQLRGWIKNCGSPNTRAFSNFSVLGMNQLSDWPNMHRYSASKITSCLAQQITHLSIVITALRHSKITWILLVCILPRVVLQPFPISTKFLTNYVLISAAAVSMSTMWWGGTAMTVCGDGYTHSHSHVEEEQCSCVLHSSALAQNPGCMYNWITLWNQQKSQI